MYLSKIALRRSHESAIELAKLAANGAYSSHQLLWQLFSEDITRSFLYREELGPDGLPNFYVLSQATPKNNNNLFEIKSKAFSPKLSVGQKLAFSVRVNPTVCETSETGKQVRHDVMMHAKKSAQKNLGELDSSRIKFLMDEAAMRWFSDPRRLSRWGFELDAPPIVERYTQHHSVKKKGNHIQFSSVDYSGILKVVDPDVFLKQVECGFGRAKAMGCGLLLIRNI